MYVLVKSMFLKVINKLRRLTFIVINNVNLTLNVK